MGETGAFILGLLLGGVGGGSVGYQSGYQRREQELQLHIHSLEQQLRLKDQRIAELERQLEEQPKEKNGNLLTDLSKKLGVSH